MSQKDTGTTRQPASPLRSLKPQFVDFDNAGPYVAAIVLGVKSVAATTVQAADTQIRRALPTATCTLEYHGGYTLQVQLRGGCTDYGFDTEARKKLLELVMPRYTAQATAVAQVIRDNNHHVGTVVTLVVANGLAYPLSVEELNALTGVQSSSVSRDGVTIKFSLVDPTHENIETVTADVAEALKVHFTRPVEVRDPNPDVALLSHYAYQPAA